MARPKHRTRPAGTYFITASSWERRAIFNKPRWAEIVAEKVFEYRDKGEYLVHAYVIMPDHLHLLLTPGEYTTLERAAQLIKGGSSHEVGVRFGRRFPVWQAGFASHLIRDEPDYRTHVLYIDRNPVKRGLVARPEEYAFGSANGLYPLNSWPVHSGAKAP
jgi:putative transposase